MACVKPYVYVESRPVCATPMMTRRAKNNAWQGRDGGGDVSVSARLTRGQAYEVRRRTHRNSRMYRVHFSVS